MENKKLHLNPLQMMQRFYDDYGKSKPYDTVQNFTCKYARKKSSDTDRLTKFLKTFDKRERGSSTVTYTNFKNTSNNNPLTPGRYEKNLTETSKRCYFKNTYTQSHPFLTSNHKITELDLDQNKPIKTEPVETVEESKTQDYRLMNPRESRRSMQEIKETMTRFRSNQKEKMDKIRYNYLVNKCYKNHKLQQAFGQLGSRINTYQLNTQQRIFPSNSLKL